MQFRIADTFTDSLERLTGDKQRVGWAEHAKPNIKPPPTAKPSLASPVPSSCDLPARIQPWTTLHLVGA